MQQQKKASALRAGAVADTWGGGGVIDVQMLQQQESEFSFNKAALESIADCLVYYGKQGIALKGHRDDSTANESTNKGNFKAIFFFLRNQ